ncbi:MAG: rhodanese-like domain-containing protein [Desulfobacteraceae bacterium]|nr:rhodanese-like domain-containing protein [Desulfobacteraceae bacterium]
MGGIPEWRKFSYPMEFDVEWQQIKVKKMTPEQVKESIEKANPFILDVRPLNFQRDTSFIHGAHLCPLVYLSDKYDEVPKVREIIITDWAMKQSPVAAKYLIKRGYRVIGVLKGGLERWKAELYPVEDRTPMKD